MKAEKSLNTEHAGANVARMRWTNMEYVWAMKSILAPAYTLILVNGWDAKNTWNVNDFHECMEFNRFQLPLNNEPHHNIYIYVYTDTYSGTE